MLVLSRKEGESVCIGDNVVVTIVKVSGNKIRVGVDAKEKVSILRGELRNSDDARPSILEFELDETKTVVPESKPRCLRASA